MTKPPLTLTLSITGHNVTDLPAFFEVELLACPGRAGGPLSLEFVGDTITAQTLDRLVEGGARFELQPTRRGLPVRLLEVTVYYHPPEGEDDGPSCSMWAEDIVEARAWVRRHDQHPEHPEGVSGWEILSPSRILLDYCDRQQQAGAMMDVCVHGPGEHAGATYRYALADRAACLREVDALVRDGCELAGYQITDTAGDVLCADGIFAAQEVSHAV